MTLRATAYTSPSSSRIRIARFPCRDDERAILAVSSGTSGQGRGCIDMTTPFCGQAKGKAKGKATAEKIMNYRRAAALEAPRRAAE